MDAQGVEEAGTEKQSEQGAGEDQQGRGEAGVCHRVHEHLHGYGQAERQHADPDPVDHGQPVVVPLGTEDREKVGENFPQGHLLGQRLVAHGSSGFPPTCPVGFAACSSHCSVKFLLGFIGGRVHEFTSRGDEARGGTGRGDWGTVVA